MADKPSREAPRGRAEPGDLGTNLERAIDSVVSLQAEAPEDGFTASALGAKRAGSGVIIDDNGLVLTIGYLIIEAESVWLTSAKGRLVPAHALAVDPDTGFGLAQALDQFDAPALPLGRSNEVQVGDSVVVAAGGRRRFLRASVVGKHEFAGYWEYYLEEAIFTAPAHPFWGGAALIGLDGKLLGVGSLHVEQTSDPGQPREANMIVPIDLLPPILGDLLARGRVDRPPRPWLGVYSADADGRIVVAGVDERGPAAAAGLRRGDIVAAVGDARVADLPDFYRRIWRCGPAGAEIPLTIVRDERSLWLRVRSADRADYLKRPRLN
jgi:S1-C subfamily serine protease